ncbi:hypothetical protein [Gottschalkia acidurici]|nr:hypothetical protein [Gottschalkia acidurici]
MIELILEVIWELFSYQAKPKDRIIVIVVSGLILMVIFFTMIYFAKKI